MRVRVLVRFHLCEPPAGAHYRRAGLDESDCAAANMYGRRQGGVVEVTVASSEVPTGSCLDSCQAVRRHLKRWSLVMKRRILISVVAAAALSVFGSASAQAVTVSPTPSHTAPGIAWTASVAGSPLVLNERTNGTSFVTSTAKGAKPLFLNPVQWFECETLNDPNYEIKSYTVKPGGGYASSSVKMFCGNSSSGYLHISQHAGEWQSRVSAAGGGTNWDDLMDYGTTQALAHPTRSINQGSQKTCDQTLVTIQKANGSSFSFYAAVVISQNNKLIITSFPPSTSYC
jgi:hypothetical protein